MLDLLAALCNTKLNQTERLLTVDTDVRIMSIIREKDGDDKAYSWMMTDLVCFIFGQAGFEFNDEKKPKVAMTKLQTYRRLINIAQQMWDEMVIYLKETHDIEIHPLAMLYTFLDLCDSPEGPLKELPGKDEFKTAIQDQITEMYKASMEELKAIEVPKIPGISDCDDQEKLIQEFFNGMLTIGTFHRNREDYETDEQKQLHDRIVATYYRLAALNF